MKARFLTLAAAGLVISGCTTTYAPPPPPVTEYAVEDCGDAPDLATAISLTPDKDKAVWELQTFVDASAGCTIFEGSATPYLVFELPPQDRAKLVELGAVLEGVRVFSPRVTLLNVDGEVTRTLNPQSYMYRNGMLSVQFVPTEDEQYALVTANQSVVGETRESLVAYVSTTTIYTGYGASNWNSGAEATSSRAFSYEGQIRALIYRPDKED